MTFSGQAQSDRFDYFCGIDWSGAVGERHKGIAVAVCHRDGGPPVLVKPNGAWSREDILAMLHDAAPNNMLVGFDFGIALPFADCGAFFPGWKASPATARELWAMIDDICRDDPHLAATSVVNHPELAPYFRRHGQTEGAYFRADGAEHGRGRFRMTEMAQQLAGCKPYSNFNLVGAAQVGKSSLTGMRLLNRLADDYAVWPIDPLPATGSVICEIYTSLAAIEAGRSASASKMRSYKALNEALANLQSPPVEGAGAIDDHSSDALLTAAWLRRVAHGNGRWQPDWLTPEIARTEGWTFGAI